MAVCRGDGDEETFCHTAIHNLHLSFRHTVVRHISNALSVQLVFFYFCLSLLFIVEEICADFPPYTLSQ